MKNDNSNLEVSDAELCQLLKNNANKQSILSLANSLQWMSFFFIRAGYYKKCIFSKSNTEIFENDFSELRKNNDQVQQIIHQISKLKHQKIGNLNGKELQEDLVTFDDIFELRTDFFMFLTEQLVDVCIELEVSGFSLFNLLKSVDFEASNMLLFLFSWKVFWNFAKKENETQIFDHQKVEAGFIKSNQ